MGRLQQGGQCALNPIPQVDIDTRPRVGCLFHVAGINKERDAKAKIKIERIKTSLKNLRRELIGKRAVFGFGREPNESHTEDINQGDGASGTGVTTLVGGHELALNQRAHRGKQTTEVKT